ncbi:MAG: hypothetical protein ABW169_02535 [Sphingobium sp.]
MTDDEEQGLSRPQRRLLRRLYNGRTTPIVADSKPFLTYKDAARYLLSLTADAREAAYAQMKARALDEKQP